MKIRSAVPSLALIAVAGCSSAGSLLPVRDATPFVSPELQSLAKGRITHVVVIIQENRTLDNFFAGYPGADAPRFGCAVATGRLRRHAVQPAAGCPSGDVKVPLHEIGFAGPDPNHNWKWSMSDWNNGRMDGFYRHDHTPGQYLSYAYVKRSLVKPYWDMAQQYVLADHMFPTEFGGSFTSHQMLVAGNDNLTRTRAEVDFPTNPPDDCDSPPGTKSSYLTPDRHVHYSQGPFPCFDQWNTMAEVLDNGRVSWKFYATRRLGAGMWEPFEAIKYVRYGPDWKRNIIAPQSEVLTDAAKGALAAVSWVVPTKPDSDHPVARSNRGPSWVASVVNAIGESSYWKNTAIVVTWDDWGGFYDNVAPPQPDFRGLGIRVPCLIISPYAKTGYVAHTRYEYASILKFIETTFGLPQIGRGVDGYTDGRANNLTDSFDFTQPPRKFVPIQSKYGPSDFLNEPPSDEPVDTE